MTIITPYCWKLNNGFQILSFLLRPGILHGEAQWQRLCPRKTQGDPNHAWFASKGPQGCSDITMHCVFETSNLKLRYCSHIKQSISVAISGLQIFHGWHRKAPNRWDTGRANYFDEFVCMWNYKIIVQNHWVVCQKTHSRPPRACRWWMTGTLTLSLLT